MDYNVEDIKNYFDKYGGGLTPLETDQSEYRTDITNAVNYYNNKSVEDYRKLFIQPQGDESLPHSLLIGNYDKFVEHFELGDRIEEIKNMTERVLIKTFKRNTEMLYLDVKRIADRTRPYRTSDAAKICKNLQSLFISTFIMGMVLYLPSEEEQEEEEDEVIIEFENFWEPSNATTDDEDDNGDIIELSAQTKPKRVIKPSRQNSNEVKEIITTAKGFLTELPKLSLAKDSLDQVLDWIRRVKFYESFCESNQIYSQKLRVSQIIGGKIDNSTAYEIESIEESSKKTFDTLESLVNWIRIKKRLPNDSDAATDELLSAKMYLLKHTVNEFFTHMVAINRRIDPYDKKDSHFIKAFIKGLDRRIKDEVAKWYETERDYYHRSPTADDVRDVAMREEKFGIKETGKPQSRNDSAQKVSSFQQTEKIKNDAVWDEKYRKFALNRCEGLREALVRWNRCLLCREENCPSIKGGLSSCPKHDPNRSWKRRYLLTTLSDSNNSADKSNDKSNELKDESKVVNKDNFDNENFIGKVIITEEKKILGYSYEKLDSERPVDKSELLVGECTSVSEPIQALEEDHSKPQDNSLIKHNRRGENIPSSYKPSVFTNNRFALLMEDEIEELELESNLEPVTGGNEVPFTGSGDGIGHHLIETLAPKSKTFLNLSTPVEEFIDDISPTLEIGEFESESNSELLIGGNEVPFTGSGDGIGHHLIETLTPKSKTFLNFSTPVEKFVDNINSTSDFDNDVPDLEDDDSSINITEV